MNKQLDIQDILALNPQTLAETQYQALKTHVIALLNEVIHDLEQDDLEGLRSRLELSPAADGHGADVEYINFKVWEQSDMGTVLDELDRLSNLRQLKDVIKSR